MTKTEQIFFLLQTRGIRKAPDSALSKQIQALYQPTIAMDLFSLAVKQKTVPILYDAMIAENLAMDTTVKELFKKHVYTYSLWYYQMLAYTHEITGILQKENIPFYLLKGVSLSTLYPKQELRRFGDVDIFLPQKEAYEKAVNLFRAAGYSQEQLQVDHHIEFLTQRYGTTFTLELHQYLIASQDSPTFNAKLQEIYQNLPLPAMEQTSLPVLPDTENALYLLLHMLQHFLNAGFGIKLLLDWTLFLHANFKNIDLDKFNVYLNDLNIHGFANVVTQSCIFYLGLDDAYSPIQQSHSLSQDSLSYFMKDILDGGEFGNSDRSRLLIMKNNSRLRDYAHEYHRQMKNRYSKSSHVPLLWPILWFLTGIHFVYNNRHIRHTKTLQVLATAKARNTLLQEMHLFSDDNTETRFL